MHADIHRDADKKPENQRERGLDRAGYPGNASCSCINTREPLVVLAMPDEQRPATNNGLIGERVASVFNGRHTVNDRGCLLKLRGSSGLHQRNNHNANLLSLSRTVSLTLSFFLFLCLSHFLSHSVSLFLSFSRSLSLSVCLLSLSLLLSLSHSLMHAVSLSRTSSLSLSHSWAPAHWG